jgi:hypothetical protein
MFILFDGVSTWLEVLRGRVSRGIHLRGGRILVRGARLWTSSGQVIFLLPVKVGSFDILVFLGKPIDPFEPDSIRSAFEREKAYGIEPLLTPENKRKLLVEWKSWHTRSNYVVRMLSRGSTQITYSTTTVTTR